MRTFERRGAWMCPYATAQAPSRMMVCSIEYAPPGRPATTSRRFKHRAPDSDVHRGQSQASATIAATVGSLPTRGWLGVVLIRTPVDSRLLGSPTEASDIRMAG